MESEFRTKLGKCVIDTEKLTLTRHGTAGTFADKTYGESINRLFTMYIILSIIALVLGITSIQNGNYFSGGFCLLICCVFIWSIISSRNNSATNQIEFNEVDKIIIHKPRPPFTRGYFSIYFNRDGKKQKRLVPLPGSMSNGKEEFQRAFNVLRETGWDKFIR
jgi:hypothetical protein